MRKAISVGVSRQDDRSLGALPSCAKDTTAVRSFFERDICGFVVKEMLNPHTSQIKLDIWEWFSDLRHNDHALFYFSGHGRRNARGGLHLCMTDTLTQALVATSLSFDELLALFKECRIGSVLIILDCCHSGAASESLLTKGDPGLLTQHKDAISTATGLCVLCSSSAFEVTSASPRGATSPFTSAFLSICEKASTQMNDWVPISQIYETLRYSVSLHTPQLIGENPVFPVLKGCRTPSEPIPTSPGTEEPEVVLRQVPHDYPLLLAMLILAEFRCWLILLGGAPIPKDAEKVGPNVYALYNKREVFADKIEKARTHMHEQRDVILTLRDTLNDTLLLLYPVGLRSSEYGRFCGVDQKYILSNKIPFKSDYYPVIEDGRICILSHLTEGFSILPAPYDYLRDAFGLIIHPKAYDGRNGILIREDSFSRNAKYVAALEYSNAIVDSIATGSESEDVQATFSEQRTTGQDFAGSAAPRDSYRDVWSAYNVKVDTKLQKKRKASGYRAKCTNCMDERFVDVTHGIRLYRVPCRSCNASYDNSWIGFDYA